MDPLSVAASIVGLLGSGAAISKFLSSVFNGAPSLAKSVLSEVADISALLSHLQTYVSGAAKASSQRQSLILLEHVLTTLTGCVLTYSELEAILSRRKGSFDKGISDRLKWTWQEPKIVTLVQRLQSHKSSLTLILNILQCHTLQQAENSNRELHTLVAEVLKSNQDLTARIKGLEREGSLISRREMESCINDDTSIMTQRPVSKRSAFQQFGGETAKFAFEQVLKASRVYNKPSNRHSLSSTTSTALYTTALSIFSNLTLSQVSNIAFFALPIYAVDIAASGYYVFGEEGVEDAIGRDRDDVSDLAPASTIRAENDMKTVTYKVENLHVLREGLGLFVRKRNTKLSQLDDLIFLSYFGYDIETDHFTDLPPEWGQFAREPIKKPQDLQPLRQTFRQAKRTGIYTRDAPSVRHRRTMLVCEADAKEENKRAQDRGQNLEVD